MKERKRPPQKYTAPALEKGLEILEFLSQRQQQMTLSQIAVGIERSRSEIFRMVSVLEQMGYIARSTDDEFSLTDKLFLLGLKGRQRDALTDLVQPVMQEISHTTGWGCALSVKSAGKVIVIAATPPTRPFGVVVEAGCSYDVNNSAPGRCLLPRDHALELEESCVVMENHDFPGLQDIAVPVMAADPQQALASLSVSYVLRRDDRSETEALRQRLVAAALFLRERMQN